jgi:microcin C transport system permease protein
MLSYQALMDKDYSLIMGTLLLTSFLMVLGNLLSDIIVAFVDPRVKFE